MYRLPPGDVRSFSDFPLSLVGRHLPRYSIDSLLADTSSHDYVTADVTSQPESPWNPPMTSYASSSLLSTCSGVGKTEDTPSRGYGGTP